MLTQTATSRPWQRTLTGSALAAAAFACTLVLLHHGGMAPGPAWPGRLDAVAVTLAVCATVPLIAWWRHPVVVFVTTAVAGVLLAGLGYPADILIGPTVALYLLATVGDRRTPAINAVLFVAYLAAAAVAHKGFPGIELLHTGLAWGAAWFAGERTRLRREHIASLHARALRAERDAERERQLAVAQERARIARDLHDSAGHALSVIAVRAGAARLRHGQEPGRSLAALRDIEQLARDTAGQIDQIVGGLREHDAATEAVEAPPGFASVDGLIAHHTAAGLTVTLDSSGPPAMPGSPADQAVYRTLQEALTNAARHGTGTAEVTIAFGEHAVEITVTNPVRPHNGSRPGGGHGLVGMRERVTLLGGTVHIGHHDGGFQLRATIPTTIPDNGRRP